MFFARSQWENGLSVGLRMLRRSVFFNSSCSYLARQYSLEFYKRAHRYPPSETFLFTSSAISLYLPTITISQYLSCFLSFFLLLFLLTFTQRQSKCAGSPAGSTSATAARRRRSSAGSSTAGAPRRTTAASLAAAPTASWRRASSTPASWRASGIGPAWRPTLTDIPLSSTSGRLPAAACSTIRGIPRRSTDGPWTALVALSNTPPPSSYISLQPVHAHRSMT